MRAQPDATLTQQHDSIRRIPISDCTGLRAGVPVKVVSERLGHASPGFTLNVYQHVLPGMQAEAAATFSRLLSSTTGSTEDEQIQR